MTHCYTTYTTVTAYTTATAQTALCCGLLLGVKTPLQVDLVSFSITTTTATATAITRWRDNETYYPQTLLLTKSDGSQSTLYSNETL